MPTYRFDEVTNQVVKSLPCPICGKKLRRQRTFMQTRNPFNKNADGSVKTTLDILKELMVEASKWQAVAEPHPKCVPPGRDWTPERWNRKTGQTTVVVKRHCNGCDKPIGDATDTEMNAAASGAELPDVRGECTTCSVLAAAGGEDR